jgi:transposase
MDDTSLAKLDVVYQAIQAATTMQEVKDTLDVLAAAKVYAQQHKVGQEIQVKVTEYVLMAERKLGEIIIAGKKAGQITHDHHPDRAVIRGEDNGKIKLSDVGISLNLSSRAQKLAKISEEEFDKRIENLKATGKAVRPNKKSQKEDKPLKPHYAEEEIIALYDKGLSYAEIAAAVGIGHRKVRDIVTFERMRREGARDANGEIAPETLSMSQHEKLERAIAREKERVRRELQASYYSDLHEKTESFVKRIGPTLQAEQDQAKRIMQGRNGFMTKKVFLLILSCLHPDWVTDPKQKRRYEDAFTEFSKLEKFLLDEKESPTNFVRIPSTWAEWEAQRKKPKTKPTKSEVFVR